MANVNEIVFAPFRALYGDPPTPDPEMFFDLYEQALRGFSDEILHLAAQRVTSEFSGYGWPKLGMILEACKAVAPRPKPPEQELYSARYFPQPSPMQKARVDELMRQFRANMAAKRLPPAKQAEDDPFANTGKPEFEQTQQTSRNVEMHATPYGLSQISKRMTGERD